MEMEDVVVNEISWAQKTNTVQPHLQKQKQTTNVDLKEREQWALDAAKMCDAQGGRQQAQGCNRTAGDGLSVYSTVVQLLPTVMLCIFLNN